MERFRQRSRSHRPILAGVALLLLLIQALQPLAPQPSSPPSGALPPSPSNAPRGDEPAEAPHGGIDEAVGVAMASFVESSGPGSGEKAFSFSSHAMRARLEQTAVTLSVPVSSVGAGEPKLASARPDRSPLDGRATVWTAVKLEFVGANSVSPQGLHPTGTPVNLLTGNDPASWRLGISSYTTVVYPNLYASIDLVLSAVDGRIKYEFRLASRADVGSIQVRVSGATSLRVQDGGVLTMTTESGEILDAAPISFDAAGAPVDCRYDVPGGLVFGFFCSGWDGTTALTIDPLVYTVFFGIGLQDWAWGLAAGEDGAAYIAGSTASPQYPTTTGALDIDVNGGTDVFVAKIRANGEGLEYLTYIGGSGGEVPYELCLGANGSAYVVGTTGSPDFPTTPEAFDALYGYKQEAFALQLDGSGSRLLYSTYLGGSGDDTAYGCSLDGEGSLYLVGSTFTDDFPTTENAFQRTKKSHPSYWDAFVAKLDPTGSRLVYSTLLGGWFPSEAISVDVDGSGNAYVVGATSTDDFPVTAGAFDTSMPGIIYPHEFYVTDNADWNLFVTKLSSDGSALGYSTYLGGTGFEAPGADLPGGIAVDADGRAFVVGRTEALDFPLTLDARNSTLAEYSDGFLSILNQDGSILEYSTFLGWDTDTSVLDLALDAAGRIVIVGSTATGSAEISPLSLGVTGDWLADSFVLVLSADGRQELHRTLLGIYGPRDQALQVVALPGGDILVLGVTLSSGPIGAGPVLDYSTAARRLYIARVDLGVPAAPLRVVFSAPSPLLGLATDGDRLVGLARSGVVLATADGTSWAAPSVFFAHSGPLGFTAWNGSFYIAQGPEPGPTRREITINASADGGATWRRVETRVWSTTASVVAAQGFGGYIFVPTCAANSLYKDAGLLRSSDGNSWAVVNSTFGKGVCSAQSMIVWKGALYAALQSGEIVRTIDGKAWEEVARGSRPQTFIDGGQKLYLGTDRGIRVKETRDGKNWTTFNFLQSDASTVAGDAWGGGLWFAGTVDQPANYGFVANLTDRGFRNVFALPDTGVPFLRFFQGRLVAVDSIGNIWATPQHVPVGPRVALSVPALSYDGFQQVQVAGFEPNEKVRLTVWDSKGRLVVNSNQTTGPEGSASIDLYPDEEWTGGTYTLDAVGSSPERQLNGSYVWSKSASWEYTPDRQVVVRSTGPSGNLTRGSDATWNLTIINNFNDSVSVVLALTVVGPGAQPLLPAFIRVTLTAGEVLNLGLVWAVHPSQAAGLSSAKVLVMTALPREGGQVIASFSYQVVVV